MSLSKAASQESPQISNGSGAAALLSAGIGAFALAVLAIIADQSKAFQGLMKFYKPTGPLSGVTTSAIVLWLLCWAVLELLWRRRSVDLRRVGWVAFALLALGFLLTFPPIADLF